MLCFTSTQEVTFILLRFHLTMHQLCNGYACSPLYCRIFLGNADVWKRWRGHYQLLADWVFWTTSQRPSYDPMSFWKQTTSSSLGYQNATWLINSKLWDPVVFAKSCCAFKICILLLPLLLLVCSLARTVTHIQLLPVDTGLCTPSIRGHVINTWKGMLV